MKQVLPLIAAAVLVAAPAAAAPAGAAPLASKPEPPHADERPRPPPTVTRKFLLGRWTDNDDCRVTIEFRSDGTFVTATGGEGLWALVGDELIFQGQRTVSARIAASDENTIVLTHGNGSVGRSTRCTAPLLTI